MSSVPSIKLTYFAFTGRAEAARLTFYIGGVPFEDKRLSHEEFAAMKDSLPLGQLPVLEVDGQVLTQSDAILRYAGRLGGLYPTSAPFAALKVDEMLHAMSELGEQMAPSFTEKDSDKRKVMREELTATTLPYYAKLIEARLAKMKELPFFQSRDVYVHEVGLYHFMRSMRAGYVDHIPTTIFDGYNLMNETFDKIDGLPKVKQWYGMSHDIPKLKLTYFPTPGRAEPIRLALFIGGIAFEDKLVSVEDAKKLTNLPFNQLPVLEVDGEVVSQAMAILRYVGGLSGLYPTTDALAAYRVDEISALFEEMFGSPGWRAASKEQDPGKQREMREALAKNAFPKSLGFFEKRLTYFKGEHAVGALLTVADLIVYTVVLNLTSGIPGIPTNVTDPYPNLQRVFKQVKAHPKVIEWNTAHE
ncbi:hypothetical protein PHYBOEH_009501 [Phytophthora boehmeriae]|uniref:Glutathione S-transferase n=1 Tax=Phytophthora boehmeriae TaxID=109152 RepID=A0A8T1X8A2_9STRA|nr:hypothetical protein PHYBOEH_009501 [Phytophthora boehmeriae]